jgi:hypothetical protein
LGLIVGLLLGLIVGIFWHITAYCRAKRPKGIAVECTKGEAISTRKLNYVHEISLK